ncbi:MAG TPA: hypothetical protein DDW49_03890 [Deltaproteobacteria bacterium]|nr:MAG: hypothetical protein A2048_09290 [Deltaproteobacteria bacterium GWA2_45_12]HBF12521.1 hypothetical protein [Deltaproteobacteria bacterium]
MLEASLCFGVCTENLVLLQGKDIPLLVKKMTFMAFYYHYENKKPSKSLKNNQISRDYKIIRGASLVRQLHN